MDPDLTRELEEQMRMLSDMISQQTAAISGLSQSISNSTQSLNKVVAGTNKLSTAQNENQQALNKNSNGAQRLQKANDDASKKIEDSAAVLEKAYSDLGSGFRTLIKTVLSGQEGFAKYNDAIGSFGNTAWDVGKNFGILGGVLGGLLKVGSEVLQYQTKQADAILGATDSFARMGAGGAITTEQVRQMGKGAGLTSLELDKLVKPMQSVKGGFVALGGTQAEGIKKFGELAAVSENVRREFKRLGMGDQERNQALADFVGLMNATGMAADSNMKTQDGLQKAALAYTRNMYELSALTGDDVETAKQKHQAAMDTYEVALFNNKMQQDIIRAEEKVNNARNAQERAAAEAELKSLTNKRDSMEKFTRAMEAAGATDAQIAAAQNQIITGAVTETSAKLALIGFDAEKQFNALVSGAETEADTTKAFNDAIQGTTNRVGHAAMALMGEEGPYGIVKENFRLVTQRIGESIPELTEKAAAAVAANAAGKGPAGTDPAQEARNDLIESERKIRLTIDDYAAKYNPLLGNTGMLEKLAWAAGIATAALAALAAFKVAGGIKDLLTGGGPGGALGKAGKKGIDGLTKDASGRWRDAAGRFAKAPSRLAKFGRFAKGLAGGVGSLVGGIALDWASEKATAAGYTKTGAGLDIGSSALTGAGIGATLGSIVPGLGTAVGGAIGGAVGGLYGLWTNRKALFGDSQEKAAQDQAANKPAEPPKQPTPIEILKATLDQVDLLQKYKFDAPTIANNAEALTSFAGALAAVFDVNTKIDNAEQAATAVAEATKAFEAAQPPLDKFIYFSKLQINLEQTKNNSEAYVAFSDAMSSYKGVGGTGLGKITNTIGMGIAEMFNIKLPIPEFVAFATAKIDPKRTEQNSKSFVNFANAMASYRGGPGLLDSISSLLGKGFDVIFGDGGPIGAFRKFAQEDFGPNASKNADAFYKYAMAATTIAKSDGAGGSGGGGGGGGSTGDTGGGGAKSPSTGDTGGGFFSKAGDLAANFVDWAKAKITGKPTDVLSFTANSGSYENFAALNPDMQKAVVLAATDYKAATGRKMQMNSGRRSRADQERLWNETVRAGRPGKGPNGMLVADPNKNPPHLGGNAIDLQEGKSDPTRAIPILAKYGLAQTYGRKDPVHFDLKAHDGGIFEGPDSGYPIEMHGSEMVAPLEMNSVLMKLAKTPANTQSTPPAKVMSTNQATKSGGTVDEQAVLNLELYGMITRKLDNMINVLENSHDTHSKMLTHAKV